MIEQRKKTLQEKKALQPQRRHMKSLWSSNSGLFFQHKPTQLYSDVTSNSINGLGASGSVGAKQLSTDSEPCVGQALKRAQHL